jgi:hypothetical protein
MNAVRAADLKTGGTWWNLITAVDTGRADAVIAGLGLAMSMAVLGLIEFMLAAIGVHMKLFALPMMASGLIFFSQPTPPSLKGFFVGSIGSSLLALMFVLTPSLPTAVSAGLASGALLITFKFFNTIFPPTAVLAALIYQTFAASGYETVASLAFWQPAVAFFAFTWILGHMWLYQMAILVGKFRVAFKDKLAKLQIKALSQERNIALTGSTLQASLAACIDTTQADYAIYWSNVNGNLVIAAEANAESFKHAVSSKGLTKSWAEASSFVRIDVNGDGPVANTLRTGVPAFISDVAASNMRRREAARHYGIRQVGFQIFESGVLEYGHAGTAGQDWKELPIPPQMPRTTMRRAFNTLGAVHMIFWKKTGSHFELIADFTTESWFKTIGQLRGDNKTFASESRKLCAGIRDDGVATISKTYRKGKEIVITDNNNFKDQRKGLAKEFGMANLHLVPVDWGVVEFGIPAERFMSLNTGRAVMQMYCQSARADYAIYWKDTASMGNNRKLVVGNSYISPTAEWSPQTFAQEATKIVLDTAGESSVAACARSRELIFFMDATDRGSKELGILGKQYGVSSICLVPVFGGVLEYGIMSGTTEKRTWKTLEEACPIVLPIMELQNAFTSGATHAVFWKSVVHMVESEGGGTQPDRSFVWDSGYLIEERRRALAAARGDDDSFVSKSKEFVYKEGDSSPISSAFNSGKHIKIEDPARGSDVGGIVFDRNACAQEFNIRSLEFIPCRGGVLEVGYAPTEVSTMTLDRTQVQGRIKSNRKNVNKAFEFAIATGEAGSSGAGRNPGKIDSSEVWIAFKYLGIDMSTEECKRLVESVDADGDGLVERQEFESIIESVLK